MSPRPTFEYELALLESSVEEMGAQVELTYHKLVEAMQENDHEALENLKDVDRIVKDMERNIESNLNFSYFI